MPSGRAAELADPEVDAYNVRLGTQTFAGLYQFTTNTLLVETAQAINGLGSDVIKFYLGPEFMRQYRIQLSTRITNLVSLVRDEPSCSSVLEMPFRHFIMWAYPFGSAWAFDGYSQKEAATEYKEIYDLTRHLLTRFNNSGKTFYLGHWEGDWYLLPNYNTATNPSPTAIKGMIDWLNNRQKAIDDAKAATAFSNVNVYGYAEVNRVVDATSSNTNINRRMINTVIPAVTNLDFLSYSSYDVMDAPASTLRATLDFMRTKLPTGKANELPGSRIWIGEYGWGAQASSTQETLTRLYVQRLLQWAPGLRFILFWEIYNNEPNRNFWLIDSNHVQVPAYYFHQRFINTAKLEVARFKERTGRVPSETEFGPLMARLLNQPLRAAMPITISNITSITFAPGQASVSARVTQGIYGDQQASVWVFWGKTDGGTNTGTWEHAQFIGVNTNFGPATFTATLPELVVGTNYVFRCFASNAAAQVWAPVTTSFVQTVPKLSLNMQDNGPALSWPSNFVHVGLLTRTNLGPTDSWQPLTNPAVVDGTNWRVDYTPPPDQMRFFSLGAEAALK